ncbi:MAG: cation transporter [Pseudomonadota bacterium]
MALSPSERTLTLAVVADVIIATPLIILGFLSGSASALSEAIRTGLGLLIGLFALIVMLAINRRKFSQFEFGVEKIQILVQIIIVIGIAISAFAMAERIIQNVTTGREAPSYVFCLLFAAFSYINLLENAYLAVRLVREQRQAPSIILQGQIKNRFIMLVSSVAATISTAAIVVNDPSLFLVIDTIGACIVFGVTLYIMVNMLKSGVLTLLDAPIDEQDKLLVIREIVEHFDDWSSVAAIRTRRLGYTKYIEIGLCFDDGTSMGDALETCRLIEDGIRRKVDNAFVAVFPTEHRSDGSEDALLALQQSA